MKELLPQAFFKKITVVAAVVLSHLRESCAHEKMLKKFSFHGEIQKSPSSNVFIPKFSIEFHKAFCAQWYFVL